MSNDTDLLLEYVQMETRERYTPVIVLMSFFGIVGLIGNFFTVTFYGFKVHKTSAIFLITYLACIDVVACLLMAPMIAEMYFNVIYTIPATCKLQHFLGHWTIGSSVFVLGFIAVDRHRKICRPLGKQVSIVIAKRGVAILITIAFILSVRDFATFGISRLSIQIPERNETIHGYWCSDTDADAPKAVVSSFHAVDALILVSILLLIIITYGQIVYALYLLKKLEKTKLAKTEALSKSMTSLAGSKWYINPMKNENTNEDSVENVVKKDDVTTADEMSKSKRKKYKKLRRSEINITIMMLAVSVGFVACFMPYFIIKLGMRSSKTAVYEMGAATQFLLRIVYLNSVLNPLAFCIFNPKFRKYIVKVIRTGMIKGQAGLESSFGQSKTTDDMHSG